MRLALILTLIGFVLIAGIAMLVIPACTLRQPMPLAWAEGTTSPSMEGAESELVLVKRVGGDLEARTDSAEGIYRAGDSRITTPLPAGYPTPTPPGAIEIKSYPLVRRAAIGGTIGPDWGMNFAFFPLFNHIKRRDIAMTSPVEMNYEGMASDDSTRPDAWTMSFLYRTSDQAPAGVDPRDDRILIEDVAPVTVIALGMRGGYKIDRVHEGLVELRAWLASQDRWDASGEPRALFYNGPEVSDGSKWLEVQIPVQPSKQIAGPGGRGGVI